MHLVRDGVDVVESTRRQWQSPPDRRYLVEKARHFPLRLVPTYGVSFARAQVRRRGQDDGSRACAAGGSATRGSTRTCAVSPCSPSAPVSGGSPSSRSTEAFERLSARVVQVRYEDLVAAPDREVTRVLGELGLPATSDGIAAAAGRLQGDRAGVGATALSAEELVSLEAEMGDVLAGLGYPPATDPRRTGG